MEKKSTGSLVVGGRLLIALLLLAGKSAMATTHVVQFGGSLGFVYSPSSFSAQVGDTVKWEGDFSVHPLSSTSVPAGAESWTNTSGTSFIYVIKMAGTYDYRCDIHFSIGMTGSFTATGSAVLSDIGLHTTGRTTLEVFSTGGQSYIRLAAPVDEFVIGSVFTLDGRTVETLARTRVAKGVHILPLQGSAHGVRFVRLTAGNEVIVARIL